MKAYRRLWRLMRGHRSQYLVALVSLILGSLVTFTIPLVGKITIDGVIAGKALDIPESTVRIVDFLGGRSVLARNLWVAGIILVVLTAFRGLFLYLRDRFSALACESISRKLRNRLYDHLQHLPNAFYTKADTGDLIQRCTSDVETLRVFLFRQVVEIGRAVVMLSVAVPLMLLLDLELALIAVLFLPFILGFSIVFFNRVKDVFLTVDKAEGEMTTVLQENLTGIRVVRAFARQDFECGKFIRKNAAYRDRNYRLFQVLAWFWGVSDLLCLGQIGVVLFVGSWMVTRDTLTIGTLYAFVRYIGLLIFPIRELGRTLSDTGKAQVALGRIAEILDEVPESEPTDTETVDDFPERIRGGIVFRNVGFKYATGERVLKGLSFGIEPGETVAVIGPSGSGKSTLVKLLLRMIDYTEGSITMDGFELKRIHRKKIRAQIGTSLQEPFLFARTLRKNIKLGRSNSGDGLMVQSAKTASIHGSITSLKRGYDTLIGERGTTLSGGQKQRVALSRMFLKEPPVLVLDDSLSAVDTDTEGKILNAMSERHGESTTIVVTHRLSCCVKADRILVLDKGELVQEGDHDELSREEGFYRRLWLIQNELDQELSQVQEAECGPRPAVFETARP
ncbi:MAG: ABC transporter ATP-binding protein [Proteobacteria bacterium]|nr:ABC transporter ATP-binding protein [Pseudomonadota bacterium]